MAEPDFSNMKPKSFWSRPEGVTGIIFLAAIVLGGGFLITTFWSTLVTLAGSLLGMGAMLLALGAIVYMAIDPKMRTLVSYMYKSAMRKITGIFVTIDPIGILKNYLDDLKDNLRKMSKQIGEIRGQMRKLKTLMQKNAGEIDNNMALAAQAKKQGKDKHVVLSTRKAARLKESNAKYAALHKKMEVMYRILTKMYSNSEILIEDTQDQVALKEQEYKAIKASHGAMKSAMTIISGDKDKRQMFDMAVEHIADDVANKVGEMERFMDMSSNFMETVDLQNGAFEEKGLKMLEEWEKKSTLMMLGGTESTDMETLDLDSPTAEPEIRTNDADSKYDNLFD